jgi:hypothetical protein
MVYGGFRVDEASHVRWEWIDLEARRSRCPRRSATRGVAIWVNKGNKGRLRPHPRRAGRPARRLARRRQRRREASPTGWVIAAATAAPERRQGALAAPSASTSAAAASTPPRVTSRRTAPGTPGPRSCSPPGSRRTACAAGSGTRSSRPPTSTPTPRPLRAVVKDWPRGEMRLRAAPTPAPGPTAFVLDVDQDPSAFLEGFLARGGKLEQLAAAAGVPPPCCAPGSSTAYRRRCGSTSRRSARARKLAAPRSAGLTAAAHRLRHPRSPAP